MTEYLLVKVLHIAALVFWLGPSLGAWLVLVLAKQHARQDSALWQFCHRSFVYLLTIEHLAFALLLGSGVVMWWLSGLAMPLWLTQKLWLVLLLLVPLEIVDIWLGNILLMRWHRQFGETTHWPPSATRWLVFYHGAFTRLAMLMLPVAVASILWLAVSKTPW